MLNQTPTPSKFKSAIKKLPWSVLGVVLFVHLLILWWLMSAQIGSTHEDLSEPIMVFFEIEAPFGIDQIDDASISSVRDTN